MRQKAQKTVVFSDERTGAETHIQAGPGDTLLDLALQKGLKIEHTCGGQCACSTCHVIVLQGGEHLTPASDQELDQLDLAAGRRPESRLACQCHIQTPGEIRCLIPKWNRNAVSEHR